ncbi:MAG: bifunctional metallophosphatase/5'-nucleotidase [Armatimonadetes bacterium]|nr:bifunctional metallophosphatase/5'-nucleotidase [Armatimonadota bacterium]
MSKEPLRPLYVDCDDVLCETAAALCQLLRQEFGKHLPVEAITDFDLEVSFGLTRREWQHLMARAHEPDFLCRLAPVPQAAETLRELAGRGCPIHVVTGRPPSTEEASRAWLDQQGIPYDALLFVDKYDRPDPNPGAAAPLTLAELSARRFRAAIDDSPTMIRFLAEQMDAPVLVLDRPWNRAGLPVPAGAARRVRRCHSWPEIAQALLGS